MRTAWAKRLLTTTWIAMLMVGGTASRGSSSSAPLTPRTNINPGLLYWQAFGAMPKLEEADRQKLGEFANQLAEWSKGLSPGEPPQVSSAASLLVKSYERSLRLLQQARLSTTPCDWGADLADGPDMLVPDTRGLRELTKVSLLKAAMQLESGSADESVDTLLSCVVLARHFAKDGTLVSVMLQQAVEGQFVDYLGAELSRYPATAVARLRQGLRQIPPRVPVLRGVESERNFQRWMTGQIDGQVERYKGDSSKAYVASRGIVVDMFGGDEPHAKEMVAYLDKASGSTVEGLRGLLEGLGSFYDQARTLAVAETDTADQAATALEQHVETSANPIALAVIPNFGRARIRELSNLSRWAMMEASVEQVLGGDAAFQAITDPLSKGPFQVTVLERGVVELRSRTDLGARMNPVLRVMRTPGDNR